MLDLTEFKLVLIEWEDSSQPLSSWFRIDDLPEPSHVECVSVGWLIHDGQETKMLAPNMGDTDSKENIQASGIIRIPARAIKRIAPLAERD